MSNEDVLLTQSLKKLKIETFNINTSSTSTNSKADTESSQEIKPMVRRRSKSLSNLEKCSFNKKSFLHSKSMPFKKAPVKKKILRDPVLNFVKYSIKSDNCDSESKVFGEYSMSKEQDFKSLVHACKKINLANKSDSVGQNYITKSFRQLRNTKSKIEKSEEPRLNNTCANQARINISTPCDITIDELASYFETFVHIPKKMSVMAEMMYI